MTTRGGSWRVAGRLARREVRRHPWRHLLVIGLILVPVLAALAAFSAIETYRTTDDLKESFVLADPELIRYVADQNSKSLAASDLRSPEVQARLGVPKGSPVDVAWSGSDWLVGDRQRSDDQGPLLVGAELIEASPGSSRASEMVVDEGRLPRTDDEIFLTTTTAEKGGWSLGDTVMSARSGRTFEVVGTGPLGYDTERQAAAVTGLPPSYWTQPLAGIDGIDVGGEYRESILATQSLTVRVVDPVLRQDLMVRGFSQEVGAGSVDRRIGAGLTMAAAAICAVVAVIASAALAISSRRQLRTIGLLSTVGTDPVTIRRAMILQGAIPGVIAGLAAVVIAVATATAVNAAGLLERFSHVSGAVVSVSVGGAAIVVLLGLASGIAAAWQPARTASRIPTLSALAGRRPIGPVPSGVPIGGAILWGVGAAALLLAFGNEQHGVVDAAEPFLIIGGIAAVALGGVGLAPAIVALLGPLAGRVRGTRRMGLRGLARHRMQSASTVAAIGVVLAIPVGLLTTRNLIDFQDGASHPECCIAVVPASTSIPDSASPRSLLIGEHGGTQVRLFGALRSSAASDATATIHDILGPTSAVVRTLPLVDQDGEWQKVAVIDEAAAGGLLEPWAVDALEAGRAIAVRDESGPVAFTAAGETATFEVEASSSASGLDLPVDASYLVGRSAMHGVGAQRPADSIVVMRADPLTRAERAKLDRLAGDDRASGSIEDPPTLEEVQAAVASGDDPATPGPAPGVHVGIMSDGTDPAVDVVLPDQSTPYDEWNRALLAMALVSGALALLVLTITLSLRSVDGEPDRRAAFAAGVAPGALRRQRAFEGVVLALLGAALAVPLGWIPVTAASLGDGTGTGTWLAGPGWVVIPILVAPAVAAAILWTTVPALTAAVRTARHRSLPDDLIPRW